MTNRRGFIKNASIATVGALMAGKAGQIEASTGSTANTIANAQKRIGLQIYSLGGELGKDVPGGLKKVAQMGYNNIELAGYNDGKIGQLSMADFKKMADDASLEIVSSHLNPPVSAYSKRNMQQIMDFWKKATDEHAAISCKLIIQPGQPQIRNTEDVELVGEIFNGAGEIAKAGGLSWGYHNHDGEFARVIPGGIEAFEGRRYSRIRTPGSDFIYDLMIKHTDPSLVFFELDVYWCVIGQQDPVAYMEKYPDRIKVLHVKDKEVLGESGFMNFKKIYETAYKNGVKEFFVEIEAVRKGMTQFDGVKGCADYLLAADFVK